MNEKYVKVDDIVEYCNTYSACLQNKGQGVAQAALRRVQEFAKENAADVQPVKRGRWTDNVYKYVKSLDAYFIQAKCSVCGRYSDRIDIYSRFMSNECCSRCGARMDGDTECQ